MAKYVRVGREVRAAMRALTPLVEPLSIDEAFLDLSGTELLHEASAARTLAAFAARIERDIGITVSIGFSCNKFLAKVASDLDKPRGFAVLDQDDARPFLGPSPSDSSTASDRRRSSASSKMAFASFPICSAPKKPI